RIQNGRLHECGGACKNLPAREGSHSPAAREYDIGPCSDSLGRYSRSPTIPAGFFEAASGKASIADSTDNGACERTPGAGRTRGCTSVSRQLLIALAEW